MAQECGFFDAQLVGDSYDRVYLAAQFAAYFASFIRNGIFGHSMQQLEVSQQDVSDMSIKVLGGQAWINGYWYRNTGDYTMNLIEDAEKLKAANITFSETALKEINVISDAVECIYT